MPLFCFTIVIYNDLPINNITVSRHIIRKPHNKNCGAKSILTTRTKGTQKKFILFHPDYNRRYWSFTNSTIMARGLYHRWGITPRPEDNYSVNFIIALCYSLSRLTFLNSLISSLSLSDTLLLSLILEQVIKKVSLS